MDGDDRRTSQYAQSYHAHAGSRPPTSQPMGPPNTADRFTQPGTPVRSDSVRQSMTRSYLPGYSQYGYTDQQYGSTSIHDGSPMQGVEMQYSPTAGYMQSARQSVGHAPSQQYAGYQHSPMLSSSAQQGMYDPIQPYQQQQSRQSAAIEVMSSQLGALPGHFDPQSAAALQLSGTASPYAQHQQQQQQQPQHFPTVPRQSLPSQQPQPYTSAPSDYPPLHDTLTSSHPQQQHSQPSQPQAIQQQQQQPIQPSPADAEALTNGLRDFHASVTNALQLIVSSSSSSSNATNSSTTASTTAAETANQNLQSATNSLLSATRWLATNIQPLGLHHDIDSPDQYTERLHMWTRLNLAWEALAEALRSRIELSHATAGGGGDAAGRGRGPQRGAGRVGQGRTSSGGGGGAAAATTITTPSKIRTLLGDLVAIADQIEGFGLVDYELGFAEELIVAGFLGVLDLLEDDDDDDGEGDGDDDAADDEPQLQQQQQQHLHQRRRLGRDGGGGAVEATGTSNGAGGNRGSHHHHHHHTNHHTNHHHKDLSMDMDLGIGLGMGIGLPVGGAAATAAGARSGV